MPADNTGTMTDAKVKGHSEKFDSLMVSLVGASVFFALLPHVLDLPRIMDPMPWPQLISLLAHTGALSAYCFLWGRRTALSTIKDQNNAG